jgi:hypothetical protein
LKIGESTMTSPPLLRKEHKNDIFRAIQAVGLDPNEFDLEDFADGVRIKHKRSESYFIVGRDESGYYVGKSLVGDGLVWPTSPASWQTLMPRISWWLEEVKQDLDTPDLWAELKREAQLLGADSSVVTENTAFTVDEQREIARRLKELGKYVSDTYSLSQAQIQVLGEKLDYLVDASTRIGRKDWLNAFIGVILSFVLTAAFAPESARTIFTTFLRGIGLFYPELPLLE